MDRVTPASDEVVRELSLQRDEARQIVRDIHWMARRYADGRRSYAVGMCNDALRIGYEGGWLKHDIAHEPPYARDGDFDTEWTSLEARLAQSERELVEARAALRKVVRQSDAYEPLENDDWHAGYVAGLDDAAREPRTLLLNMSKPGEQTP